MNISEEVVVESGLANEKALPKDAQIIVSILRDIGITEFEPRVINQLLDFTNCFMTTILDDAKLLSHHARKRTVDVDDVKLAVQMYTEENLINPTSRDVILETARVRNAQPLPQPKPTSGLHLPPDRFCITACNYKLAKAAKKKPAATGTGPYFSNPNTFGAPKMMVAPPGSTLIQPGFALVGKSPAMPPKSNVTIPMPKFQIQTGPGLSGQTPMFSMTINPPQMQGIGGIKRKSGEMDS